MDLDRISNIHGATVIDTEGNKVGTVDQIYQDDETGRPEWMSVKTGLFGLKSSFVPLQGARFDENDVVIPHHKDVVKDAPNVDADEALSAEQERELYEHYGVQYMPWSGQSTGLRLRRVVVVSDRDPSLRA